MHDFRRLAPSDLHGKLSWSPIHPRNNKYDLKQFRRCRDRERRLFGARRYPLLCVGRHEDADGLPTLDAICERINAKRFTLLHIVCHGRYARDRQETVLYLLDDRRQVDSVRPTSSSSDFGNFTAHMAYRNSHFSVAVRQPLRRRSRHSAGSVSVWSANLACRP